MTLLELVRAYLQIGMAVTVIEMLFFFPWGSVTEETERHLGHLGLPTPVLSLFAVIGVVYAAARTLVAWPEVVYGHWKRLGGKA